MALFGRKCPCLRPQIEEEVRLLDYRHCSLRDVPGEVFNFERTLEELLVDSNQIQDLPRELFYCHGIRRLCLSDNEIKQIPAAIGSLISLEHLDLSKNGVIDIPENIKSCKYLQTVDASVNPLGKLPDGFTQLLNLTQLYLNDTFLDYLPGNFGRLCKLKILEVRENHLKTLPKSFSRLIELEKLDIGHNEFNELPDVIGSLCNLLELWCDHNQITSITPTVGNLKQLMFFDGCKNNLQSLPSEIEGCTSLADLHLTTNRLQELPDSIGNLSYLTTLKVDDNCLVSLPTSLGELSSLSELNVSANDLEEIPASLGLLRYLRTLYADNNELRFIPAELGSCSGITVLSLRSNKLTYIPDELGRIPRLRVLNLSSNQLKCLPFTVTKLKELQALWLSENQTCPIVRLQSDHDPETGRKILTCYLLPQQPLQDSGDMGGDTDSFHPSMWDEERRTRQQIHFEFGDDSDADGNFIRQPTPYPKEMREKARHLKNLALRQQMSNGHEIHVQGEDNHAYEERHHKPGSPSMERLALVQDADVDGIDVRVPGSPSLHDPYSLYKYDKQKQAKDKVRLQQRHSSQEDIGPRSSPRKHSSREGSPASERGSRKGRGKKSKDDEDDGGFREHRVSSLGSTPDIPSATDDRVPSAHKRFTYCSPEELTSNISSRSGGRNPHSHSPSNRSHRQRRMRDYDSDTGYRSDQELLKFRQQQQQMFQRLEDNYSEIVPVIPKKGRRRDGYSSDLEGYSHRVAGLTIRDMPPDTNSSSAAYTNSSPYKSSNQSQTPSKSASHHSQTPSKSASHQFSQGASNQSQTPSKSLSHQFSQGVTMRNDELYDYTGNGLPSKSPSPFARRKIAHQSTPLSPQSLSASFLGAQDEASNSHQKKDLFSMADRGQEGLIDPQNRYMPNPSTQPQILSVKASDSRPTPPYKSAPAYAASPGSAPAYAASPGQYAASPGQRQLPPTPNRSSPYGVSQYDRQARNSPMKDYHKQMPDIKELSDSKHDLSQTRSRTHVEYQGHDAQNYRNSDGDRGNYLDVQNMPGDSPRTPTSHSANVIGHGHGDITSASSKDSGNYSYLDRTTSANESPVNFRNSPLNGLPERRNSRTSPFSYSQDVHRTFDKYDNTFREPTTVDIPTRYDDIAMFKSSEPPSQVSSSTDSGYGYGHSLFEKLSESHRMSGTSQGSPSPDQFNSDSNCTASPHREYSRGTTPVNHGDPQQREQLNDSSHRTERFRVTITKKPGLGFSIAGGVGSYGNPFRPSDMGIFVTKVQQEGPAAPSLRRGDKLLEVNGMNFRDIDHHKAVSILKTTGSCVQLYVERGSTS